MLKSRKRIAVVLAVMSLLSVSSMISAETWHLEQDQSWKAVDVQGQDKYLLAVAQIKNLVNMGQTEAVRNALDKLKKDFPEIAGPDLDAFIEAEILFCQGKFPQAVRAYNKFLAEFPQSQLYEAALDRQFAIATAYLAGRKKKVLGVFKIKGYAEGVRIMEKITDLGGDAPIGLKAALAVAESYEKRGKFDEAYYEWSQIRSRWPTGQTGKDALLAMARCKHAAYRGPQYDVSNLISAKSYYENFKLRYPGGAEKLDIDERLKLINEQLAYKQFSIGRYYQQTGNKLSANLYYQMVIDIWPESTAAKMTMAAMNDEKSDNKKEKKWEENLVEELERLFL